MHSRIEMNFLLSMHLKKIKTSIKCVPWDKKTKVKDGDKDKWITLPAFGITFTRNGSQVFRIPIEPGEVENLMSFLSFYLKSLYEHRKIEEAKKMEKYKPNKQTQKESHTESDDAPFNEEKVLIRIVIIVKPIQDLKPYEKHINSLTKNRKI